MEERAYNQTTAPQPTTFLGNVNDRLNDIKQVLYGINERLNAAGFYPGPGLGDASVKGAPAESHQRAAIDETIDHLANTAASIREQVNRLVG